MYPVWEPLSYGKALHVLAELSEQFIVGVGCRPGYVLSPLRFT